MRSIEPSQPGKPPSNRFRPTLSGGRDPSLARIGLQLRAWYGLVGEPVPELLLRLLDRLDDDAQKAD